MSDLTYIYKIKANVCVCLFVCVFVCLSVCTRNKSDKRVLNDGEYDVGWDYDWD